MFHELQLPVSSSYYSTNSSPYLYSPVKFCVWIRFYLFVGQLIQQCLVHWRARIFYRIVKQSPRNGRTFSRMNAIKRSCRWVGSCRLKPNIWWITWLPFLTLNWAKELSVEIIFCHRLVVKPAGWKSSDRLTLTVFHLGLNLFPYVCDSGVSFTTGSCNSEGQASSKKPEF